MREEKSHFILLLLCCSDLDHVKKVAVTLSECNFFSVVNRPPTIDKDSWMAESIIDVTCLLRRATLKKAPYKHFGGALFQCNV